MLNFQSEAREVCRSFPVSPAFLFNEAPSGWVEPELGHPQMAQICADGEEFICGHL